MTTTLPPPPSPAPRGATPASARLADRSFPLAFIGGGNMAGAIVGGLVAQGWPAGLIDVQEPHAATRDALAARTGAAGHDGPGDWLSGARVVVWAVKPQVFREVAQAARAHLAPEALHLSVAAGIRSDAIAKWLGSERIVRAMPNTPAMIGRGIAGLYARAGVDGAARAQVERLLSPTGDCVWVDREPDLDAVTALSGSGPAYVFYLLEAMCGAGEAMGLAPDAARRLSIATFGGAAALAHASTGPLSTLRGRVTSKGGTTDAALKSLAAAGVAEAFGRAIEAARARAVTLGDEFGNG